MGQTNRDVCDNIDDSSDSKLTPPPGVSKWEQLTSGTKNSTHHFTGDAVAKKKAHHINKDFDSMQCFVAVITLLLSSVDTASNTGLA